MTQQDENIAQANTILAQAIERVDAEREQVSTLLLHAQIHLLTQTTLYAPVQRKRICTGEHCDGDCDNPRCTRKWK